MKKLGTLYEIWTHGLGGNPHMEGFIDKAKQPLNCGEFTTVQIFGRAIPRPILAGSSIARTDKTCKILFINIAFAQMLGLEKVRRNAFLGFGARFLALLHGKQAVSKTLRSPNGKHSPLLIEKKCHPDCGTFKGSSGYPPNTTG